MLLFGHIGITAGAAKAYDMLASMTKSGNSDQPGSNPKFGMVTGGERLRSRSSPGGIDSRVALIDYRLVSLGSLLPDIIDKPVWFFASRDSFFSGRDYAHTLLFNLALLIGGLVLPRYKKSWLLVLSLSSFMHLILDQMWSSPVALLWPLLGSLPKGETVGWWSNIFRALFSSPAVYVSEIIGLLIVLFFAYRLVMEKRVFGFLKSGAIG